MATNIGFKAGTLTNPFVHTLQLNHRRIQRTSIGAIEKHNNHHRSDKACITCYDWRESVELSDGRSIDRFTTNVAFVKGLDALLTSTVPA